jgi:trans-aconitate methyltransferase
MFLPRMYTEFAQYCQLMNPREDYATEAPQWSAVLRRHLGPGRHEILELGTGGGNQLSYWADEFKAVAVDLSAEMIEQARRICPPDVEFHVGDMRTIHLGRTFKAVLISDAIDYITSQEDLLATFATAAAHLEPGGVLVTCPDYYHETFRGPISSCGTNSQGSIHFTNIEYIHDPDPADTTIDVLNWYLLLESGKLRIEQDRHVYGLFPLATWTTLMQQAGFAVEKVSFDAGDPGHEMYLLVGVLRR